MILVIDNYDSFTYNLVQMLESAEPPVEVVVLRNDVESAGALLARHPEGILLSPGPCRPEDAGVCVELLQQRAPVPILGVCLGHQAL
ncbi:MAG: aminodeoxychorismate/anthranilate synthase component II, partial [Gammaproteobacteria bacterium]|nr:aminodeoxychorismate/anthranilate synthase component II [Gammaproteobacteria bacterium]